MRVDERGAQSPGHRALSLAICCLLGPFARRRSFLIVGSQIALIVLLTILTQVGDLALWLAHGVSAVLRRRRNSGTILTFVLLYTGLTAVVVPRVAPYFGRVPLDCFTGPSTAYAANSPLYCTLHRHYVRPKLKLLMMALSAHVSARHPGSVLTYLDAGFPFPLGLPLLPHLSHRDGRSLDVALFYETTGGARPVRGGAWWLGYWAFAPARRHEAPPACRRDGFLRWRMESLQGLFADLSLDHARNREMLSWLRGEGPQHGLRKVFIEPYLKHHLGVEGNILRHAGCNAARHDDHIHLQM